MKDKKVKKVYVSGVPEITANSEITKYTGLIIHIESEYFYKSFDEAKAKKKTEVIIEIDGKKKEMTFSEFRARLFTE